MNLFKLDSAVSEDWQKYAQVDHEVKVELCDEQVKDAIQSKQNSGLSPPSSPQYTGFTAVSMTSSIRKNKLLPQLIVCIERLPVVTKAKQEYLPDKEDSDINVGITSNIKKNKLQPHLIVCIQKLPVVTKAEQDIYVDHLSDYLPEADNSDQYLIEETKNEVRFSLKLSGSTTSGREACEILNQDQNSNFRVNTTKEEYIGKIEYLIPEEVDIKSEDEESDQSNTKSSADEDEKGLHPTNRANTNNPRTKPEESSVFNCPKCSYQTYRKSLMSKHILGHKSEIFQCTHCTYRSKYKQALKRHQLVHTPNEEPEMHKCPKCPFQSKRHSTLYNHLIIHKKPNEITWYHCQQCSFKTKHKSNLENGHMMIHRKEQPMYKCALCSYESPRKSALQRHLKRMHRRVYSCPNEDCLYTTHDQRYLAKHIRRPHKCGGFFKCSKCPYQSRHQGDLRVHELGHESPDKWHSCPRCPFKHPPDPA